MHDTCKPQTVITLQQPRDAQRVSNIAIQACWYNPVMKWPHILLEAFPARCAL